LSRRKLPLNALSIDVLSSSVTRELTLVRYLIALFYPLASFSLFLSVIVGFLSYLFFNFCDSLDL